MSHNSLVRNPVTNWVDGGQILDTELGTLAENLAKSVNGDRGGCWAPSEPITIGGSGLVVTGPTQITRTGTLRSGGSNGIRLEDGDYPILGEDHAGRTRVVKIPFAGARQLPTYAFFGQPTGASQAIAGTLIEEATKTTTTPRIFLGLRPHDLATLSQVKVFFRVGTPHTAPPPFPPKARVLRLDFEGNVEALTSSASGADVDGYVSPTPTSGTVWYANGAMQSFTVACDQKNVVDLSLYDYVLEVTEEGGLEDFPFTTSIKQSVKYVTLGSNVTMAGLTSFDPLVGTFVNGDRVLVKDQSDPRQNGIWIVRVNAWQRARDLDGPDDFVRGFVTFVELGTFAGSVWQCSPSIESWEGPGYPFGWTLAWYSGTFVTGFHIFPTAANATGYYYVAAIGGGAGGTEPNWPTTIGQEVVDNAITWRCEGKLADPLSFVGRRAHRVPEEIDGTVLKAKGIAWQMVETTCENIATARWA